MQVAVLDDWQGVAEGCADWSALMSRAEVVFHRDVFADDAALHTALKTADVIMTMRERTHLSDALICALPRLRLVALAGNTTRHLNPRLCAERGIALAWSGTYRHEETAEFTMGLILAAERDIARGDAAIRAGGFQRGTGLGGRLCEMTLGLLGFGRIGASVAGYARAFGMEVLAWSPSLTPERAAAGGARAAGFDQVLAAADIVSLHMWLTPTSAGIIDARALAAMKPGALLVNTARGGLVDEPALVAALHAGRIRAALDVFQTEPLPAEDPLRSAPNTLLTPHLGFSTRSCMGMFYRESIENILAWMDGRPIRQLDPPV